jgi:hypothetical protein
LRAWRLRRLPWYRRAARAEARETVARWQGRMLQAELERWQLRGVVWPLLALIDWWGSTRGLGAARRRGAKRVPRASSVARMVAAAAAAAALTAVATLALVVVAISQLV